MEERRAHAGRPQVAKEEKPENEAELVDKPSERPDSAAGQG